MEWSGTLIVSLLALVVSVGGALTSLHYESEQLTEVRKDNRAWIGQPKVDVKRLSDREVTLRLYFPNVGKTPTGGLFIGANKVTSDWEGEIQRQYDKGLKLSRDPDSRFFKTTAVPGSETLISENPDVSVTFNRPATASWGDLPEHIIAGCAVYTLFPGEHSLHRTGFTITLDMSHDVPRVQVVYAHGAD